MRKSRGRREGEKEESSGKVKREEMGEMARGGVGENVVAREGRGKKKGSRGSDAMFGEDNCSRAWSRAMPARKSAHLLNSRGV